VLHVRVPDFHYRAKTAQSTNTRQYCVKSVVGRNIAGLLAITRLDTHATVITIMFVIATRRYCACPAILRWIAFSAWSGS